MAIDFEAEAAALKDELVARRRDLHRHPELAFQEVRTAGIVASELTQLGLEVQTGVGKTGVVGILESGQAGPTVLVRADMDALPIHEENQTDYVSAEAGKMHACGHDAHTAIGLAVAKILSTHREQIRGCVKFVFQPAEEIAGGAKAMVADGVLEAPRPDVTLGLHLWNNLPLGKIGVADGPIMAGSNSFSIELTGKGGHGASPHLTVDPVVCAAQMVTAFQTIVSRNVPPLESGVLSVTQIHTGDADNVIPQRAIIRGTTRAFSSDVHALLRDRMAAMGENIAMAMNCTFNMTWFDGTLPVANDAGVASSVRAAIAPLVGTESFVLDHRTMGAEDVGYFMRDIPGMFLLVGSANAERGLDFGHHHPRFDFDEDVLPLGAALMAKAVASYVLPDAN